MLLCEIFDKKYPFRLITNEHGEALYNFVSAIGPFNVYITLDDLRPFESARHIKNIEAITGGNKKKEISARKTYGNVYEVAFKPVGGTYKQTHKNEDMYGIIGTTIAIMVDYAKKENVAEYSFTADLDEPGRVKLYDRMCKDLTHHNFKLVKRAVSGGSVFYVLDNVNIGDQ